jgi:dTDP-4-dehydrorhamnose reductase
MRILLLGKNGQLGRELLSILSAWNKVTASDIDDLDLTEAARVRAKIREARPSVIINAAAYTDVDGAESHPELANIVNRDVPAMLAEEARSRDAAFIHYSTDFVFDGSKGSPYTEQDSPNPINVYGKSKLLGEEAVRKLGGAFFIFRTSWVYGLQSNSFVTKALKWSRVQREMRVVDDQIGSPTWTRALAQATSDILAKGADDILAFSTVHAGLYHLAGLGAVSRYDWAKEILALDPRPQEQTVERLLPARSADFPAPATRPPYSALDSTHVQRKFGIHLSTWQEQLREAMKA